MASKPLPSWDPAEIARLMERAKQVAGWGSSDERADNVLLTMMDPNMTVMHRLHFYCDSNPNCVTYNLTRHASHTLSLADVDKLLDAAARIPRSDWNPETSVNRKGKAGLAVSVSTKNFA